VTEIRFTRCDQRAKAPAPATGGAAGFDLVAIETTVIRPGEVAFVRTGITVEVPDGYTLLVCSRSGLAARCRVTVANAPGVVDRDYRDELTPPMANASAAAYTVAAGDRFAQAVVVPAPVLEFVEVDELTVTARGRGGFGSTGK
jgi:dUTP pyrophosphatase